MTLLVADTSSLVSLGCTADDEASVLGLLIEVFEVVVPEAVAEELETLASYEHPHRDAADAAEALVGDVRVVSQSSIADSVPPLDPGERAAIELANTEHATYLLCDGFTNLTLIASALGERTELLTTPALMAAFVVRGVLEAPEARTQLDGIAADRSWEANAYYRRARQRLDRLD